MIDCKKEILKKFLPYYLLFFGAVTIVAALLGKGKLGAGDRKAALGAGIGSRTRRMENFNYTNPKWRHKQKAILKRDGYQCRECRKYGRAREAKIVHHIKPVEDFPELAYEDSNLESLCIVCHNKKHPEKAVRRNHGYRKGK